MMPEWLAGAFSLTREISSKIALPVFVVSAVILIFPERYDAAIGVDVLRKEYKTFIGFFFLFSFAVLASNLVWWCATALKPMLRDQVFILFNKGALKRLTEAEKAVLRRFIQDGESTISASVNNGTINLLEYKGVIIRSSNIAIHYTTFPWILQPWARAYLTKHQSLLI